MQLQGMAGVGEAAEGGRGGLRQAADAAALLQCPRGNADGSGRGEGT